MTKVKFVSIGDIDQRLLRSRQILETIIIGSHKLCIIAITMRTVIKKKEEENLIIDDTHFATCICNRTNSKLLQKPYQFN